MFRQSDNDNFESGFIGTNPKQKNNRDGSSGVNPGNLWYCLVTLCDTRGQRGEFRRESPKLASAVGLRGVRKIWSFA